MQKISNVEELKSAILLLELQQKKEEQLLKAQFRITYERLRPVNLIKNTIHDLVTAPDLKKDMLSKVMSIAAGYISKKLTIGNSSNPLKQFAGTVLQMSVSNVVSNNSEGIKLAAARLINTFINKSNKEINNETGS